MTKCTTAYTRPRYKVGDRIIINHGYGAPNRTITVTLVSTNHGAPNAHRYWGTDASGVSWGAYETQVVRKKGSRPVRT